MLNFSICVPIMSSKEEHELKRETILDSSSFPIHSPRYITVIQSFYWINELCPKYFLTQWHILKANKLNTPSNFFSRIIFLPLFYYSGFLGNRFSKYFSSSCPLLYFPLQGKMYYLVDGTSIVLYFILRTVSM